MANDIFTEVPPETILSIQGEKIKTWTSLLLVSIGLGMTSFALRLITHNDFLFEVGPEITAILEGVKENSEFYFNFIYSVPDFAYLLSAGAMVSFFIELSGMFHTKHDIDEGEHFGLKDLAKDILLKSIGAWIIVTAVSGLLFADEFIQLRQNFLGNYVKHFQFQDLEAYRDAYVYWLVFLFTTQIKSLLQMQHINN